MKFYVLPCVGRCLTLILERIFLPYDILHNFRAQSLFFLDFFQPHIFQRFKISKLSRQPKKSFWPFTSLSLPFLLLLLPFIYAINTEKIILPTCKTHPPFESQKTVTTNNKYTTSTKITPKRREISYQKRKTRLNPSD